MEELDVVKEIFYGVESVSYFKKGTHILHREDGPALVLETGSKSWYVNGKRHRIGGPAIEWVWGAKQWYVDGQLHRDDGPAVEWDEEGNEWWINGVRLSPEKEAIMNMWWYDKNGI